MYHDRRMNYTNDREFPTFVVSAGRAPAQEVLSVSSPRATNRPARPARRRAFVSRRPIGRMDARRPLPHVAVLVSGERRTFNDVRASVARLFCRLAAQSTLHLFDCTNGEPLSLPPWRRQKADET